MAIDKNVQEMMNSIDVLRALGLMQSDKKGPLGLPQAPEPPKDPLELMGIKSPVPQPPKVGGKF